MSTATTPHENAWVALAKPRLRAQIDIVPQDWAALASHLAAHGMAFDADQPARQFAGGFGNLNYLVAIDGIDRVLRRPPPGIIAPGANDMAREHVILSRLGPAFPLAPASLHYTPDASVLGAHFLIMEYRAGLSIGGTLPDGDPPGNRTRLQAGAHLGAMLVDTLVALHAVDPGEVGLDTLGRPEGFVARTASGWEKRAHAALVDDPDPQQTAIADIAGWLARHLPPDRTPTLLHSDFKLDNVLVDPATLAPVAVLDWDMGTRGDPLFDLATLLSYWTEPNDPQPLHDLHQMPTTNAGFMTRAQVVEAYARAAGCDVSDFPFYRVLALFKLAVIFLQIYRRYSTGVERNPRYAGFGVLGRDLLDVTSQTMRGRLA